MSELNVAIEEFRSAYDDLLTLVDQYPAARRELAGACGEWSARQVLAHCSGWIVEAQRRYDEYLSGESRKIKYDFDEFNAGSVTARQAMNWNDTVGELRGLVAAYIVRAERIPAEKAAEDKRYAGWLDALSEDCRDHTDQLRVFAEAD